CERRYTVCHDKIEHYQVPVRWTTYRPEYKQHCVDVPCVTYRTVLEPCEKIVKTHTCEPVYTTKQICVKTGDCQTQTSFTPGPGVTRCCRLPGTWEFDPCPCRSHYCPGPVVTQQVQLPGRHVCKRTWIPRDEVRTVTCCHYVRKEHCHTVKYNVCRVVPE